MFIRAFLLLCFLPLHAASQDAPSDRGNRAQPPNIVFILIDDLGYGDLGCYGSDFHETPHIDALAADGMRFSNAYSNAPNCAPTRACLMTGQYPPRHGIYTVGSSERGSAKHRKLVPTKNTTILSSEAVTIAEVLRERGYATAHIGKWHLGSDPTSQGFDINFGGSRAGYPKSYFSPYLNPVIPNGPKDEYLTDRLTDEAISFMREHREQPFFLYLSHFAVHTPVQAKPDLAAKYAARLDHLGDAVVKRRQSRYAAMLESVDESVGRIVAAINEIGVTDNTIIMLMSDNGGHANYADNGHLRGSKGMLYEGGVRSPLIAAWPTVIAAGSASDVPVMTIDIFPTLMELAGINRDTDLTLDGESLLPLLRGEAISLRRDAIFWHFPAYLEGYTPKHGRWRTTPAGSVRMGEWKLIEFFEDGSLELYNLTDDPKESRNRAETEPARRDQLLETMRTWRREIGAPVPTIRNPEYGR